jgi:hypothetical protein
MGLNQMQFVDPTYLNEQKQAYDAYKRPTTAPPKKHQQNFIQDNDDMEEEMKQPPPNMLQGPPRGNIEMEDND